MPELQIDVTVANRFISSLSKSLQALCHGCMDFDSGIEIVGYINVNIDSGSKVDYVLNEKVLKSTTNSMTFVSNSFLAKKEPQKQTRDGTCSPIPQSQAVTSYPSRMHGSQLGSQFHRAASQYSPHSQVPGGSQKRSWADDWRLSSKRHRVHSQPTETQSFTDQNSLNPQSHLLQSSSHTYSESSFKQPIVPTFTGTGDSTPRVQMNIKKEVLEAENQSIVDSENLTSDQSEDQTHDSSHDEMNKIQIKSDPDAAKSDNDEPTPTDDNNITASESTDFKGTFLEPPSSNDTHLTNEDNGHSESDIQLPAFDQSSELASNKEQILSDEINAASASNLGDNDASVSAENEPTSDVPIEYDQAAEDGSYSQSAYEDAGEGSSDAGQFEVIEIDDEDEDVQAMFGDNRIESIVGSVLNTNSEAQLTFTEYSHKQSKWPLHRPHVPPQSSSILDTSVNLSRNVHRANKSLSDPYETLFTDISSNKPLPLLPSFETGANMTMKCHLCGMVVGSRILFQKHMNSSHRLAKALPFTCTKCNMGFFSLSGLQKHVDAHGGRRFSCEICSARFTHKHHWKRHCIKVHKLDYCA